MIVLRSSTCLCTSRLTKQPVSSYISKPIATSSSRTFLFNKRTFSSSPITIPKTAKVIQYESNGAPEEVLRMKEVDLGSVGEDEMMVQVLFAPINPADLNIVEGRYGLRIPTPSVAGNECVARVIRVGNKVRSVAPGDYVIPSNPNLGTWRTYGVFKENDWQKFPNDIKPEYAATISVNPCTAFRLLEDFVSLKEGDVIVQNGANSMVGLAVIQIAAARKLRTINIIRERPSFDVTVDLLKRLGGYMVVSDQYFSKPQFKRLMSDLPSPKLALNCIGDASATEMLRILGNDGTLVTYGGMSRQPLSFPTGTFIFKNVQCKGFWLTKWLQTHSKAERNSMLEALCNLIRKEQLTFWLEKWDFNKFDLALEKAQRPFRDRKIVLSMEKLD